MTHNFRHGGAFVSADKVKTFTLIDDRTRHIHGDVMCVAWGQFAKDGAFVIENLKL